MDSDRDDIPTSCGDCGSDKLTWAHQVVGPPGIADGRHRTSELTVLVFLGCDVCSATVFSERLDQHLARVADEHRTSAVLLRAGAARIDALHAVLRRVEKLHAVALKQFNWGASALSGEAIQLLNEVPGEVRVALHVATLIPPTRPSPTKDAVARMARGAATELRRAADWGRELLTREQRNKLDTAAEEASDIADTLGGDNGPA